MLLADVGFFRTSLIKTARKKFKAFLNLSVHSNLGSSHDLGKGLEFMLYMTREEVKDMYISPILVVDADGGADSVNAIEPSDGFLTLGDGQRIGLQRMGTYV